MRQKIDCLVGRLLTALFFIIVSSTVFGQKKVSGTVLSARDNGPVNGATVLVKGTTIGTTTALNGTFSINVPSGKNTLVLNQHSF